MLILDDFFSQLSALTGGATDHLKVVFTLVVSYPIALIFKHLLRNPNIKHLFSIVFAIIVLFGVFDLADAFYVMLTNSLVVYTIMYYVKGAWGPRLVFLFTLGHLSVNHIYRQLYKVSYDNYDQTGPQMVLVIKLTSFAFNVFDGRKPSKELTPYQKNKAITSMPSMLEYFGYIFFFNAFMIGPAFEFMDYYRFTNMEMFRIDDGAIKKGIVKSSQQLKQLKLVNQYYDNHNDSKSARYYVPNGFIPAMSKLGFGLFFILCYIIFGGNYPMDWTLSKEFQSISFMDKLLYIQIASFCARFKFYIIWLIAEGGCILAGLGFNGYDEHGNAKWDRVSNIDVVAYETADNIKSLLEAWNMNTNKWLKNYVYLRITPHGQKPTFFTTFATFGTSAVWHGFYPGYYLTFATGAFVQSIHRILRRQVRPIFLTPRFSSLKPLYDFLGWLFTQTMIHYIVIPFNILSLRESLHVWRSLYFCGHIAIILLNVVMWLGFNRVCKTLIRIGGGIDAGKELKEAKEQIRMQKAVRKEFGGGEKVAITETGIPSEVEDGLVNLKKEE